MRVPSPRARMMARGVTSGLGIRDSGSGTRDSESRWYPEATSCSYLSLLPLITTGLSSPEPRTPIFLEHEPPAEPHASLAAGGAGDLAEGVAGRDAVAGVRVAPA